MSDKVGHSSTENTICSVLLNEVLYHANIAINILEIGLNSAI